MSRLRSRPYWTVKTAITGSWSDGITLLTRVAGTVTQGDIVVTAVANHFAIGRLTALHEIQSVIEAQPDRMRSLKRACTLAGDNHRVFLAQNYRQTSDLVDCTDLAPYLAADPPAPTQAVAVGRRKFRPRLTSDNHSYPTQEERSAEAGTVAAG